MNEKETLFLKKLLETFKIESQEHLREISRGLARLEKVSSQSEQKEVVETIFREAHSLKGAARAVNLPQIETICRSLESVFSELKENKIILSQSLLESLHQSVDKLSEMVSSLDRNDKPASSQETLPKQTAETIRVPASKLDALFLQAEELFSIKLMMRQRIVEMKKMGGDTKAAEQDQRTVGSMVDRLLEEMKNVMMLPFSTLLEVFPRYVRELSRDQGKEADLAIEGGELELDRRVLEEMKDPFIHLLRNAVVHGIESPAERERKKKPRRGSIRIAIRPKDGNKVEISVSDDGGGMDAEKIKAAAVKAGILSDAEAKKMSREEGEQFIYNSGVSTSPVVTDLSGRGLGMAIVQEKIEKLGGEISFQSATGQGTQFHIVLPLKLSACRGILISAGEQLFVIPTNHVERVLRVPLDEIKTVENREVVQVNGESVSLARLSEVLNLKPPSKTNGKKKLSAVVLHYAKKRIAFLVDEILNEQEVLVKNLVNPFSQVARVAGATVLGSGKVVPILSVSDLMKGVFAGGASRIRKEEVPSSKRAETKKSVLVVEDSITARTLIKNILESAGFNVKTAVDGVDAFTQLRSRDFDAVVSDVQMPRMNGFDLTSKIRGDEKLAQKPVVLVTALESREDREKGIDAGANAYIVKSNFDQSNLIEVLRRFL